MAELIPHGIAAHLIDAKSRADEALARSAVVHEALALLIGDLHRRGLTDALQLADRLEYAHRDPEICQLIPGAADIASVLAARIRGASLKPEPPTISPPQDG